MKKYLETWKSTILVAAVGAFFIFLGTSPEWLGKYSAGKWLSEVGIACLIAAIVTYLYERQARERFATDTVEDVLTKVMGDIVNPGIWREMREQILEKVAVREKATVRFRLYRPQGMENGRCVLRVVLEYRLQCLRSDAHEIRVLHFVDAYMADPSLKLPKLTRVEIDGEAQDLKTPLCFDKTVKVGGRHTPAKLVYVDRDEIVYVPGAYNLLMSELTELESIALDEVPTGIKVTVNHDFQDKLLTTQSAIQLNRYLLPGQSIEVRFEATST